MHKERKSNAGRPGFDYVLMFKILVLQSLYNVSDHQIEYQIRDRLSFMRFLKLSLGSPLELDSMLIVVSTIEEVPTSKLPVNVSVLEVVPVILNLLEYPQPSQVSITNSAPDCIHICLTSLEDLRKVPALVALER